jgi:hypothetical protein
VALTFALAEIDLGFISIFPRRPNPCNSSIINGFKLSFAAGLDGYSVP